jgi:tetratricopeptide (TPR) repeat protein
MNIEYLLLLKDIIIGEKTGELQTTGNKMTRVLYFQKGVLTYCSTNNEKEKLLNIIYDELNYIGKKRYKQLLKYVKGGQKEKLKLGQKLVLDKVISSSQLFTALNKQAEIVAVSISKEKKTNLEFFEKPIEETKDSGFRISAAKILSNSFMVGKIDKDNEKLLDGKIIVTEQNRLSELLSEKDMDILNKLKKNKKITKHIIGKKSEIIKSFLKLYVLKYITITPIENKKSVLNDKKESIPKTMFDNMTDNYGSYQKETEKTEDVKKTFLQKIDILDKIKKESDDKENLKEIIKKANILHEKGKYREIIKLIKDIPNYDNYDDLSGKIVLILARAEANVDIYKQDAEKHFLSLIKHKPWVKESYYELLSLYEKENLTTRAKPIIKKALKFFPDDHEFYRFEEIFLKSKKIKLFS